MAAHDARGRLDTAQRAAALILVDTNVLLDVFKRDAVWLPWSAQQLRVNRPKGLAINAIVYAELCGHPGMGFDLDAFLDAQPIVVAEISRRAAKLAADAFKAYRQRGGAKTSLLPDFFIGAQAAAEGWALLTRDVARYRTYFPSLKLICP